MNNFLKYFWKMMIQTTPFYRFDIFLYVELISNFLAIINKLLSTDGISLYIRWHFALDIIDNNFNNDIDGFNALRAVNENIILQCLDIINKKADNNEYNINIYRVDSSSSDMFKNATPSENVIYTSKGKGTFNVEGFSINDTFLVDDDTYTPQEIREK